MGVTLNSCLHSSHLCQGGFFLFCTYIVVFVSEKQIVESAV